MTCISLAPPIVQADGSSMCSNNKMMTAALLTATCVTDEKE